MKKYFRRLAVYTTTLAMLHLLVGCGTILHPERKGQISGQVDPSIVLLNGLGLLFFLVPGVVAFAVDFSNGTIYLPEGQTSQLSETELEHITVNGEVNMQLLEQSMQARVDPNLSLEGAIIKKGNKEPTNAQE